jgi:FkbM family methyltransferase
MRNMQKTPVYLSKVAPDGKSIDFYVKVSSMYLQSGDNRSDRLLSKGGITQKHVFAAWRACIRILRPDVILDIGANHGEMTLPLLFENDSRVFLFEPNGGLSAILARSAAEHIQADRIVVESLALSDTRRNAKMTIDKKWSGTSSLDYEAPDAPYKGEGEQHYEVAEVQTVTLDDYLDATGRNPSSMAVKIDVEGHEPKVLRGAARTLASVPFALITEYDPRQLQLSGFDGHAYLRELAALGTAFFLREDMSVEPVSAVDGFEISHGDLLIASAPALVDFVTSHRSFME